MVKERRASESPVSHLGGLNARTDRRVERRALTADECRKLLAAAARGTDVVRHDRAGSGDALPRALERGFAGMSFTVSRRGSSSWTATAPTVTVQAAYSKHRRDDTLPLRHETAAALKAYLADRLPDARAFPMPERRVGGGDRRGGLEGRRGSRQRTRAGRVLDFHALRHTFITNLCNGRGASEDGAIAGAAFVYHADDGPLYSPEHCRRDGGAGRATRPGQARRRGIAGDGHGQPAAVLPLSWRPAWRPKDHNR